VVVTALRMCGCVAIERRMSVCVCVCVSHPLWGRCGRATTGVPSQGRKSVGRGLGRLCHESVGKFREQREPDRSRRNFDKNPFWGRSGLPANVTGHGLALREFKIIVAERSFAACIVVVARGRKVVNPLAWRDQKTHGRGTARRSRGRLRFLKTDH
jgi:hypothetical protein